MIVGMACGKCKYDTSYIYIEIYLPHLGKRHQIHLDSLMDGTMVRLPYKSISWHASRIDPAYKHITELLSTQHWELGALGKRGDPCSSPVV